LFAVLISILLSRHYTIKKMKIRTLVVIGGGFLLLSFLFIIFRSSRSGFNIQDILFVATEGTTIFENTFLINRYIDDTGTILWGRSIVTSILHLFPQWILPIKKDLNLVYWFRYTFFENITEYSTGRMFSIVAEGYLNFRYAGPFIIGFFYANFIKAIYHKCRQKYAETKHVDLFFVAYLYFLSYTYIFFRGDVATFLSKFSLFALPVVVFLFINRKR